MSHPKTDIVVLTHNRLDITKGFVDAVFKNTDPNLFNLIFVDNCSTDGTKEYLIDGAKNNRWSLLPEYKNVGIIKGRNDGANLVVLDYFVNLDNDQYPEKNWLQILHDKMAEGYSIVGCEAWRLTPADTKGAVVAGQASIPNRSYYPYYHCQKSGEPFNYIGCGGMLIDRRVYDAIGLFDERFSPAYFEDPDFSFRAHKAGFKLAWEPKCRIRHLAHQTICSQKTFDKSRQFLKSWLEFQKKWYPFHPGNIITE